MSISMARNREDYVRQVKTIGQHIIDNADDIVGNLDKCVNIHIETDVNHVDVPVVDVTKSTYVPMERE